MGSYYCANSNFHMTLRKSKGQPHLEPKHIGGPCRIACDHPQDVVNDVVSLSPSTHPPHAVPLSRAPPLSSASSPRVLPAATTSLFRLLPPPPRAPSLPLARVVALLRALPEYARVVVSCARKTAPSAWPLLFAAAGDVRTLFEAACAQGDLATAANCIRLLEVGQEGTGD